MNNELLNDHENRLMLAMDTSSSSMTVAVLRGTRLLGERSSQAERNHSMYLIPAVQELLAELRLRPADLQVVSVGHGPGSYTGVRIGITVAKTMAWALGCPVVAVSSLASIALGSALDGEQTGNGDNGSRGTALPNPEEQRPVWFVPLLDARRTQTYTALFATRGGGIPLLEKGVPEGWSRLEQDGIRLIDKWVDLLLGRIQDAEVKPKRIVFTGETDGFHAAVSRFAEIWSGGVTTVQPFALRAYHTGLLGLKRRQAGETDDVHGLVPNYTQLAEAEVKLQAKQRG